MTREEHVRWAKKRAHEYLTHGDFNQAVTSMLSDLSKHPETAGVGDKMSMFGMFLLMKAPTHHEVARFIDGFAE